MRRVGFAFLLLSTCATAQQPKQAQPNRSNNSFVFEQLRTHYRFENDGTGQREQTARVRILAETGTRAWTERTFEFHPDEERLQISYFRIIKPGGETLKVSTDETPHPSESTTVRDAPKFDYDEKRVFLPPLSAGDVIEYAVDTEMYVPAAPGQFWVQHNFSTSGVLDERVDIDVPIGRAVKVKTKPGVVVTSVTEDNGRRIYHWKASGLPVYEYSKKNGSAYPWDLPPDAQLSSFVSWQEVGLWYRDLERNRRATTPEVRAKADELTRGVYNDLEKAEALYDYAAKKIRYISLSSLGIGGYVPHAADETLHNQYGDCKDKAALLAALLEAEGMHASSVLISPGRKLDPDIPSPWPFTHVITVLTVGKDQVWMDTSSPVLPFGMLVYQLRDKQGLVVPLSGAPHFQETPASSPVPNTWAEEIDGLVSENGTLDATVRIETRGDSELRLREVFLRTVESMWPWSVASVVKVPNREVSDIKIGDPTETNKSFTLSFRITRSLFVDSGHGKAKMILPLSDFDHVAPDGDLVNGWARSESESVNLGPPGEYSYRITLRLPQRFALQIPEPLSLEHDYGGYHATYKVEGDSLIAERRLVMRRDQLSPAQADAYRNFRQKLLSDADQGIGVRVSDENPPTQQ